MAFEEPEKNHVLKIADVPLNVADTIEVGKPVEEKVLGRFETELLEQERKRKVESFLNKVGTIESDVDQLNTKKP